MLTTNLTPSCFIISIRLCTTALSSFIFGIPYIKSPPGLSLLSYTVTSWPLLLSFSAAARPDGPEPITATFFPVRTLGGSALIRPFSKAYSIIPYSFSLIVTGSSLSPHVHAASHGAGHTRDVNSGKLFVFKSLSSALSIFPRYIMSFHSGIRLLSGQPEAMPLIISPD